MTFQDLIFIAAVLLSIDNRVVGLNCPFKAKYESPDVAEKNFFGVWYPQYLIANYDLSSDDVDRFACSKFSAEKSKNNHYQLKLKRFDPKFENDDKLNLFDDFFPVSRQKFGRFYMDDQKDGGIFMYTGYIKILDMFQRADYMVILSCSLVKDHQVVVNGFVMRRKPQMWYGNCSIEYRIAKTAVEKSLTKYLVSLSDVPYEFRIAKLTQNVEICTQFDPIISGARTFVFSCNFYCISIILFVLSALIQ